MDDSTSKSSWLSRADAAQIGRGLLMGAADIIPGVSGGTVALILGIYERLVAAISRFDQVLVGHLLARRWKSAADHVDFRFLLTLGIGIGSGIVALGSVMHYLLEHQQQYTFAAFFGLIGASCWMVGRLIKKWTVSEFVMLVLGAIFAVWLVTQPALKQPPEGLWYVFACGVIAICAMILPGISGAFILLILGKYHAITGIIKQALHLQVTLNDILTVVVFALGCATGLIGFSKFLKWLLSKYHDITMATLCGFMVGSLWKIWPFQRDMTPEVLEFKEKVFSPIPLAETQVDFHFFVTIGIVIVAASAAILLERKSLPPTSQMQDSATSA